MGLGNRIVRGSGQPYGVCLILQQQVISNSSSGSRQDIALADLFFLHAIENRLIADG